MQRPGAWVAVAVFCFVLGLLWALLWWAEARRGLLTPWFPGYFSAPGMLVGGALALRRARLLREVDDRRRGTPPEAS
jgi:hypothetical protein